MHKQPNIKLVQAVSIIDGKLCLKDTDGKLCLNSTYEQADLFFKKLETMVMYFSKFLSLYLLYKIYSCLFAFMEACFQNQNLWILKSFIQNG